MSKPRRKCKKCTKCERDRKKCSCITQWPRVLVLGILGIVSCQRTLNVNEDVNIYKNLRSRWTLLYVQLLFWSSLWLSHLAGITKCVPILLVCILELCFPYFYIWTWEKGLMTAIVLSFIWNSVLWEDFFIVVFIILAHQFSTFSDL